MEEIQQLLTAHPIFRPLTAHQIEAIADTAQAVRFSTGDLIFRQGDPGDTVLLVASGAIDLFTYLSGDIERTLHTVRAGQLVGALAVVDPGERPAWARAAEPTQAYRFDRNDLVTLLDQHPDVGIRIMRFVADNIAQGMRVALAQLHQNLEWTLEVAGVAALDVRQLIVDQAEVVVELINGKRLTGVIVKAEAHRENFELFLKTDAGKVHFIPYHAIVDVSLPLEKISSAQDTMANL
jgi:CRP-like cAMP-binding protein